MDTPRIVNGAGVVRVERWPTELPLLGVVILASIGVWVLLAVSIFGLVYAVFIAAFLFVAHLLLIAHIRGSGVRIGPEQFPDLHARVEALAAQAGLATAPAAYVMQAGGALNAFAAKLFRSRLVVLFSDLLDACGDDTAARDMIIGHELGHIRARHLDWMLVIVPGMFVPFLGAAYSRARERTCDRYGAALCGDPAGAKRGLAVLAAGGSRARLLNLGVFERQGQDLDTGWMTIAKWLSGYPPLCDRIAALEGRGSYPSARGPLRALGILAGVALLPLAMGGVALYKVVPWYAEIMEQARRQQEATSAITPGVGAGDAQVRVRVYEDMQRLADVVGSVRAAGGAVPADHEALYRAWSEWNPEEPGPLDPYDGKRYAYYVEADQFVLLSSGPDGEAETDDDIVITLPLD